MKNGSDIHSNNTLVGQCCIPLTSGNMGFKYKKKNTHAQIKEGNTRNIVMPFIFIMKINDGGTYIDLDVKAGFNLINNELTWS